MKTLAERYSKRPTHYVPNGCGSGFSARIIPDAIGSVRFRGCCDQHDLVYHVGGFWGLFTRRPQADWAMMKCIHKRFVLEAERINIGGDTLRGRWIRRSGVMVAGIYWLATTLLGWTPLTWPWRKRPVPTHEELSLLNHVKTIYRSGEN